MSLLRETAFDILGLPTFATVDDIVLRYKSLALTWFPEGHYNPECAVQEFSNISQAAVTLLYPQKTLKKLKLEEMYGFFQYIFFGDKAQFDEEESDSESSIPFEVVESILEEEKEIAAEQNASELINEEEREKIKSDKRKAKKKKRKEKKKQIKLAGESGAPKVDVSSPKETKQKNQGAKNYDSEEELDTACAFVSVIAKKQKKQTDVDAKDKTEPPKKTNFNFPKVTSDPNSFVPVLSKKQKKQQTQEAKTKVDSSTQADVEVLSEDLQDFVLQSRQLALRGNELASTGYYTEAVEFFNESIKLDPTDHRFYGNRSYCFDRLGQHERSLSDAEKSIALSPVWPKGYFRRGRAFLGLRKYALAEQDFIEVLKRDEDCDDAISELRKARVLQIVEKGYSKEAAEAALSQHNTVPEALQSLLANGIFQVRVKDDLDSFVSDDEPPVRVRTVETKPVVNPIARPVVKPIAKPVVKPIAKPVVKPIAKPIAKPVTKPEEPYDIKMDPTNPECHTSLWIGNVQADVTEKKLISMFAKFGELINIKVMNEKFCAFVNYKTKNGPGQAMKAYQGYELCGAKLLIRFPNLPGEAVPTKKKAVIVTPSETKVLGPVNGYECYFWRTSGCSNGNKCRYQHIKEHKGIDAN